MLDNEVALEVETMNGKTSGQGQVSGHSCSALQAFVHLAMHVFIVAHYWCLQTVLDSI